MTVADTASSHLPLPGYSSTADIDGPYRYTLTREWDAKGPPVVFVMLNPSTADADVDDPTIRRCLAFARTWGCGSLTVVNLYALRSPSPEALWRARDPVGPRNDAALAETTRTAMTRGGVAVAAWGVHAREDRVEHVLGRVLPADPANPLFCLGTTRSGAPRHPLFVPGETRLQVWP